MLYERILLKRRDSLVKRGSTPTIRQGFTMKFGTVENVSSYLISVKRNEVSVIYSLFKRLYQLIGDKNRNHLEDYLTEIFAEVLQREEVFYDFLNLTKVKVSGTITIKEVTTQKTYEKQETHISDSRPDMLIRFMVDSSPHIMFIENKLGSSEGELQLRRYSDHLKSYEIEGCQTHLIYITKGHDPKQKADVMDSTNKAYFYQLRWYQVYTLLKQHPSELINLLLEYMEEMQLNDSRRFLPQDIYAIQNMERLIRMMDSCLDGHVEEAVTKLFGRSTGWTNRFAQLKDSYRYMKQNDQGNFTAINFGFHLTDAEYPMVSILFEINPKCPRRGEVIQAVKEFLLSHDKWNAEDLEENTAWVSICYDESLLTFMTEADHVQSIQNFFIIRLNELYQIKQIHPELGWK